MIRPFFLQTTALAALDSSSSGASVFDYNSSLAAMFTVVPGPSMVVTGIAGALAVTLRRRRK